MNLRSSQLKGTSKLLKLEALHLSPSIGLLTWCSPSLVSNLRSCGAGSSGELAKLLFHQRKDETGRRYGPTGITNSKSNGSYWLNPKSLGCIVGLGMSSRAIKVLYKIYTLYSRRFCDMSVQGDLTLNFIDASLSSGGIECNYVDGVWSGVSLERYRKLIYLIADDHRQVLSTATSNFPISTGYAFPLLLRCLLEKSVSKKCFLDFLLSVERHAGCLVIRDEFNDLRVENSAMTSSWLNENFVRDDLTTMKVLEAGRSFLNSDSSRHFGEDLEIVAVSLAQERAFKVPLKLGKYSVNGGQLKPDCVEVLIREVVEALIYGAASILVSLASLYFSLLFFFLFCRS
jgi:hypothetical protein